MIKRFLTRLCIWSYGKVAKPIDKAPMGLPYIRDPENICEGYMPFKPKVSSWAECETDGHYLCQKCSLRKTKTTE